MNLFGLVVAVGLALAYAITVLILSATLESYQDGDWFCLVWCVAFGSSAVGCVGFTYYWIGALL